MTKHLRELIREGYVKVHPTRREMTYDLIDDGLAFCREMAHGEGFFWLNFGVSWPRSLSILLFSPDHWEIVAADEEDYRVSFMLLAHHRVFL